jgi:hypothetical protein
MWGEDVKKYQKYLLLFSSLFIISITCFHFLHISNAESNTPINQIRVIPTPKYMVPNSVIDNTNAIKAIPIIPEYEIVCITSVERYEYLIITYRKIK